MFNILSMKSYFRVFKKGPFVKELVLWYSNSSPECKLGFPNISFTRNDVLLYMKINNRLVTDTRIKQFQEMNYHIDLV